MRRVVDGLLRGAGVVRLRRLLLVAVDDDRRATLLAADLDDLPEDLLVRDGVLGLTRLAGNFHGN